MVNYVAGFLFDEKRENVALIRKLKPDWQRGLLNAIGGKIENGETPYEAMVREFTEETGQTVHGWRQFCKLCGINWTVYFFEMDGWDLSTLKSVTEEYVQYYPLSLLPKLSTLRNLRWLIPLALDSDNLIATVLD